jgi:uncharacterized membrane protein YkvA (DUF1232 family)
MGRFRRFAKLFKRELAVYRAVLKDPRTPLLGKILLGSAIAYLLMPIDLIPDWIPLIIYHHAGGAEVVLDIVVV